MILVAMLVLGVSDADDETTKLRSVLAKLHHDLFVFGLVHISALANITDGHEHRDHVENVLLHIFDYGECCARIFF